MRAGARGGRHPRLGIFALLTLCTAGCAGGVMTNLQPAVPSGPPPALVVCHDGTGHVAGATPWVLGGNCCCTPTRAMFDVHQAEQTVPAETTYEAYLKHYADRGIKVSPAHAGCNNRCADGPHVVFGGRCMAAPTPGTPNYERVSRGRDRPTP